MNKIIIAIIIGGMFFSGCATVANKIDLNEKGDSKVKITSLPNNAKIIFYDKSGNKLLDLFNNQKTDIIDKWAGERKIITIKYIHLNGCTG